MASTTHLPAGTAESGPVKRSVRLLRVSSKAQTDTDADIDPDGNSIDTQRKVTMAKERAMGVVNVGEYVEPGYSGQSIEKRPFFKQLLQRITTKRDVDYVVIYMRSRVFRNYIEAAIVKQQLEKLGVRIVSAKEDFGDGFMAEAMEAVTDVFNWLQVKMSGQDIAIKMGNKARNGGTIGRAKIGYLNDTKIIEGHKVNTISVDPERAAYVRKAFELFATAEYTLDELQEKLADAGFTMPAAGRWPQRPISRTTLAHLLRDRYYLGEVQYQKIWYPGRHEALVDTELFDRVQRVLDAHSGSGVRQRTHRHYLKGLLWCARCRQRFTLMRGKGNGGEYFYFLCRGKQDGICDMRYIPVEVLEDAVADYYASTAWMPAEIRDRLRNRIEEALSATFSLTDEMRDDFARQLAKLDRREHYFLDLAAEEGWPKDKLREKIDAIRTERAHIHHSLKQAEQQLDIGKQVFYQALDILDNPGVTYRRGGEEVRSILNKTFFTRLYVDARKVTDAELREPFDVLHEAYRSYESRTQTSRTIPRNTDDTQSGTLREEGAAYDQASMISLLTTVLSDHGSSKQVMVGTAGFEPATP